MQNNNSKPVVRHIVRPATIGTRRRLQQRNNYLNFVKRIKPVSEDKSRNE